MSYDAPESTQKAMSFLLYIAILILFAQVIAWDTEWRAVDRNLAEAVLLYFSRLIFASLVLPLILSCLFSTLGGLLTSVKLGGITVYVLMGFIIELLSTISLNTGSSSESDEYRLLYPLEVGVGAARFVIRRTVWSSESGGTVEYIVVFKMEGGWTCLAEIWS